MSKPIIQLNEETVKSELKEMVRNSVEETLNALLNKEAEELTSAAKYERTESRQGYRSGHYSRKLTTTSGQKFEFFRHVFEIVFICIFHRFLSAVRLFGIFAFRP